MPDVVVMPSRPATFRPTPARPRPDPRPSACKRGYDRQWRKRRASFLAQNPICVRCQAAGRIESATVADHVVPHRGDPDLFHHGQLQALCEPCHNRKTATEDRGSAGRPTTESK